MTPDGIAERLAVLGEQVRTMSVSLCDFRTETKVELAELRKVVHDLERDRDENAWMRKVAWAAVLGIVSMGISILGIAIKVGFGAP